MTLFAETSVASRHGRAFLHALRLADARTTASVAALRNGMTIPALAASRGVSPAETVRELHAGLSTDALRSAAHNVARSVGSLVGRRTATRVEVVSAVGPGDWAGFDLLAVLATISPLERTGVVIGPTEPDGRRPILFHSSRGPDGPVEFIDDPRRYNIRVADLRTGKAPKPAAAPSVPPAVPMKDPKRVTARPAARPSKAVPRASSTPDAGETLPANLARLRPVELALLKSACRTPMRVGIGVAEGIGGSGTVSKALDALKRMGLLTFVRGGAGGFVPAAPRSLPAGWFARRPEDGAAPVADTPKDRAVNGMSGTVEAARKAKVDLGALVRRIDGLLLRKPVASAPVANPNGRRTVVNAWRPSSRTTERAVAPPADAEPRMPTEICSTPLAVQQRSAILRALSRRRMNEIELGSATLMTQDHIRVRLAELEVGAFVGLFADGRLGIPSGIRTRTVEHRTRRFRAETLAAGTKVETVAPPQEHAARHATAATEDSRSSSAVDRARALLERAAGGEPVTLGTVGAAASLPSDAVRALVRREFSNSVALGRSETVARPRNWNRIEDSILRLLAGAGRMEMLHAATALGATADRFDDRQAEAATAALAGVRRPGAAVSTFLRSCAEAGLLEAVSTSSWGPGEAVTTWIAMPPLAELASAVRFDPVASADAVAARDAAARVATRSPEGRYSPPEREDRSTARQYPYGEYRRTAARLDRPILDRWWAHGDLSDHTALAEELKAPETLVVEALRTLVRDRQLPDEPDLVGDLSRVPAI